MKQTLTLEVTGHIKIFMGEELVVDRPNAVLPNSMNIVRRALAGTEKLDFIRCLASGSTLGDGMITNVIYDADLEKATYEAVFDENSFTGVFDKIELRNTNEGIFAEADSLAANKVAQSQMKIQWTLKFNKQ